MRRDNFDHPFVLCFLLVNALQGSLFSLCCHASDRCIHSTLRRVVSTWTHCGGRLAPRRANERYTAEPSALARLVCQAYHRHPGSTTCRPHCLNSLTPDAHRAGPLHPRLPRFATFHYRPRCAHLRVASFRFCRSYRVPATILHAITAAVNSNHLCVMKQPVEQRTGKNLVP